MYLLLYLLLRGLTMNLMAPEAQFAGSSATLSVVLTNDRTSTRYGIGLAVLDATHEDRWVWTDVPPQGMSTVHVAFKPQRRGLHRVPPLTAETRFPALGPQDPALPQRQALALSVSLLPLPLATRILLVSMAPSEKASW